MNKERDCYNIKLIWIKNGLGQDGPLNDEKIAPFKANKKGAKS